MKKEPFVRTNTKIRAKTVRVISGDENLGVMSIEDALSTAKTVGLDLVEVSPKANPPVCKIIDYGKFKYEQSKNKKQNQVKKTKVHEIKFGVNIDPHDLGIKVEHIKEFLNKGDKVKITITFKGRQMAHKELGYDLVDEILDSLGDVFSTPTTASGKSIILHVEPKKVK